MYTSPTAPSGTGSRHGPSRYVRVPGSGVPIGGCPVSPRPAAVFGRLPSFMFGRGLTIRPQPGMLVGFPAWIEHWVHPFFGSGERISIAVNIDVTRYEVGTG